MDHLNKNQLILLALLISFVSSIATGIVTVTLMQQAPQGVTQTINRVVERTIEKVTQVKGPTLTETKIIKEEDFVISAVDRNSNSIVKIAMSANPATGDKGGELSNGLIVSSDGYIITDSGSVVVAEETYYAVTADGQILELSRLGDKRGFTVFRVLTKEKSPAPKLSAVSLADSSRVKAGQSVISLGSSVATGIISGLSYERAPGDSATSTPSVLSSIHTSTNQRDELGSAVMDLDGNTIGMVGIRGGARMTIPSDVIRDALADLLKKQQ